MNLVDESRVQILLNRSNAPADPNVLAIRCRGSSLQGGVNSIRDEMEGRSTLHLDRRAWMAGQHEHRDVIRRNISPPAFPSLIRPGSPHGSEHVPSHDPGADVLEAPRGKVIVYPSSAGVVTKHALERPGPERPLVQS